MGQIIIDAFPEFRFIGKVCCEGFTDDRKILEVVSGMCIVYCVDETIHSGGIMPRAVGTLLCNREVTDVADRG